MLPVLSLILIIICSLIGGALLSYPVYYLFHILSIDISFNKSLSHVTNLCGFIFIFLFLKLHGLLNRDVLGYRQSQKGFFREITNGIGFGILIMFSMEIILLVLGIHKPENNLDLSLQFLSHIILKGILVGLFVGLLEETMYRGALLGGLTKLTGFLPAILISSFVYSAVHFIKFPEITADTHIIWTTGLVQMSHAFNRFTNMAYFDTFLALMAFGSLLALVRINKGNIYQSIGIHAGVVLSINVINELTDFIPENNHKYLVNQYDHMLGYLAFVWLLVISIFYYRRQITPE